MINVSKLTKDYGARRAIDNLTFKAERGEIIGFLGPNGAGKTTTMRILSGYMPPTSGKAEIGGFDVVDQSLEVRKIVGYLPETVPLYQDMTVFEFLKYNPYVTFINTSAGYADLEIELNIENSNKMMQLMDEVHSKFPGVIKKYSYFSSIQGYKLRCLPEL